MRLAALVLAVCGLTCAVRALVGDGRIAAAQRVPARAATLRVQRGDTLWAIALAHAPAGADPRPWIFRTEAINGLRDAELVPGEVLRLPAGSR